MKNNEDTQIDFTIVTASYNYGRYIGECIESVIAQKGVTYEHIIFDGGSTDDTVEVVSRYKDVHFVQEPDSGMCDAINKGFRVAKGKWVMWLNSDDRLHPAALAEVKRHIQQNPEADVVYGGWNFVNSDGSFKRRMTLFPHQPSMLVRVGCYIGSTAAFYKRESVIDEGHLLNERFQYVMDGEYYARLHKEGKKFSYLPRVLADFRWHGENLSIKNFGGDSVDDWLTLQKQFAESRAIKRAYGHNFTSDENLNSVVDCLLYGFWRGMKPFLKLLYISSIKENKE